MPNSVYSIAERVEIIKQREQGLSFRRIADHFAAAHPDRPIPSLTTIGNLVEKFRRTGNLNDDVQSTRPSKQLSDEMKFNICLKAEEDPNKSYSKIAGELRVSASSVRKVLLSTKLKVPKFPKDEECSSSSGDRDQDETMFSQTMIARLKTDEISLRRVCFSNESTILYVSKSKKQNVLLCSWRVQHRLVNRTDADYQKLHVWTGAVGNQPVGPFFLDGTLSGEQYLKLLRDEIVPALKALDGDGPVLWYQQNGAPPYHTADVFEYLNEEFSGRWIGRDCPVQRLSGALDMSLLDHALAGRLKNMLYAGEKIRDLSELQTRVSEIFGNMDPQAVCSTIRAHYDRGLREEGDVRK